ncbi:hypothetical protein SK128_005874, partial [Halocaridina rubra]
MVKFRVKHLIIVCLFSVVYICYSLYLDSSNYAPIDASLDVSDERDAIDMFIDKYINEGPDNDISALEHTVSTEESITYLYVDHEFNSDEVESDYEYEEVEADDYDDNDDDDDDNDPDYFEETQDDRKLRFLAREILDSKPKKDLKKGTSNSIQKGEGDVSIEKVAVDSSDSTIQNALHAKKTKKEIPSSSPHDSEYPHHSNFLPVILKVNQALQDEMKKQSPILVLPRDSYWPTVLEPSDSKIYSEIDYTKYEPEDRAYLLGRVGVYEERARAVGEVCRNNPHLLAPTPTHTFVWDTRHDPNIVWCEISKVASTSWMVNFLRLGHYRENDTSLSHLSPEERDAIRFDADDLEDGNLHLKVFRLFPAPNSTVERNKIFSNALRFIIVRHPLARLLSAYQDKMTTLNPIPKIYNFRQLQMDIIK